MNLVDRRAGGKYPDDVADRQPCATNARPAADDLWITDDAFEQFLIRHGHLRPLGALYGTPGAAMLPAFRDGSAPRLSAEVATRQEGNRRVGRAASATVRQGTENAR